MRCFRIRGILSSAGRQIEVSGGTKTTSGSYTYHTFTASGSLTIGPKSLPAPITVEYQLIGGGTGGSQWGYAAPFYLFGGGGGGGVVTTGSLSLGPGTYTVGVGAGGAQGGVNSKTHQQPASKSTFDTVNGGPFPMLGGGQGGAGGKEVNPTIRPGGVGSNGSFAGGNGSDGDAIADNSTISAGAGGGGGGRNTAGGAGVFSVSGSTGTATAGNGGGGFSTWISGTLAGGGGGGANPNFTVSATYLNMYPLKSNYVGNAGSGTDGGGSGFKGTSGAAPNGTANTGGGGGGGGTSGGQGGSGIVILRYETPIPAP